MNTTRSRERGFSLLETLIATSILTVTLAGLAQLLVGSMRVNAAARTTTYAALLAQQTSNITGLVRDASGGVIESATVTLTETSTNTRRVATTNALGEYSAPSLRGNVPDRSGKGSFRTRSTAAVPVHSARFVQADQAFSTFYLLQVLGAGERAVRHNVLCNGFQWCCG